LGQAEDSGEGRPLLRWDRLIAADELVSYAYDGFWALMDTLNNKELLESLVESGLTAWQALLTTGPAVLSG
jgi:hypothetical protein